jgi:hypothetical protein
LSNELERISKDAVMVTSQNVAGTEENTKTLSGWPAPSYNMSVDVSTKMIIKEIVCEGMDLIHMAQNRVQWHDFVVLVKVLVP